MHVFHPESYNLNTSKGLWTSEPSQLIIKYNCSKQIIKPALMYNSRGKREDRRQVFPSSIHEAYFKMRCLQTTSHQQIKEITGFDLISNVRRWNRINYTTKKQRGTLHYNTGIHVRREKRRCARFPKQN